MVTMNRYKLEPKRMRLVYPYVDKEPNMVLVEATRGGKPRLTVETPRIVYRESGVYMPEIYDIYGRRQQLSAISCQSEFVVEGMNSGASTSSSTSDSQISRFSDSQILKFSVSQIL